MKVIEVPIYNEDGSVKMTLQMSAEEAQAILQFSMNFLVTSGLAANYAILQQPEDDKQGDLFADMKVGVPN